MMNKLGFDLETTGTDPLVDKPVQACVVCRNHGDRIVMNTYVNPMQPIDKDVSAVHGIDDNKVKSAPDYVSVAWQLSLISKAYGNPLVVTFNGTNFDIPMINACLGGQVFDGPHIDVLRFVRHYFPYVRGQSSPGGKTLSELYELATGHKLVGAHDAAADVIATLDVLESFRRQADVTLTDLIKDLSKPKAYEVIPFGKYAGTKIQDMPKSWASFMLNKAQADGKPLDADLQLTVERILAR